MDMVAMQREQMVTLLLSPHTRVRMTKESEWAPRDAAEHVYGQQVKGSAPLPF
jgi:hypothetical protein